MLHRRVALVFAIPLLAIAAPMAACGDPSSADATNVGAGTEAGAAIDGSGTIDGAVKTGDTGTTTSPPPPAKGDPCRGQPLPADQHFVAPGLCARLVSAVVPSLRQIMFAPNGDMFGQRAGGQIHLFRDEDGDGFFTKSEIHEWANTGGTGNNAHVDANGGYVYAGSDSGVKRFKYDPSALVAGAAQDVVVGQPSGGNHAKHTVHVYDGFLYVHSGSSENASHSDGNGQSDYDTKRSLIKRFDLSKLAPGKPLAWDEGEAFTVGLRNANGFTRNEITKKLYAVVNGLDAQQYQGVDVHNDNPGEQVVELATGKKYGYPFCFTAQRIVTGGSVVSAGTQLVNVSYPGNPHGDVWCAANSSPPTTFVQAHSAPLDIAFFDAQPLGGLPEKWRGGAFLALHGSWNRDPATGYKVVWVPFNADGSSPMPTSTADTTTFPYEIVFGGGTVAGGAVDKPWAWSSDGAGEAPRPAGVAVNPIDGALYVASDADGLVYRIGATK